MGDDIFALCVLVEVLVVVAVSGEQVVELVDEAANGRNKLDETLRDENHAEVVAFLCALCHCRGNLLNNLVESHVLGLNLLRDEADVRLGLKGAFQGDVRGRASHQLDEVPIFTCRVSVALNVADKL